MPQVATAGTVLAQRRAQGAHFKAQLEDEGGPALRHHALGPIAGWPATAIVALVVTVLTWRWQAWPPVHAGLSSWQAGLSLAFARHLQWGPQVVFTFGPYGLLEDVVPFSRLGAGMALVYGFAVRYGLASLVASSLRKSSGIWLAGAGTWLAVGVGANLAEAPAVASALALGLALRALGAGGVAQPDQGPIRRNRTLLLALLGGLAGLQLLVEVSSGLVCTGLALLASLCSPHRRPLREAVVTLAGLAAVALAAQAAAGQSLSNLPSYLRGELAVALGYTPAMSLSTGRLAEDFFGLVDLALLAGLAAWALRGRTWQQKLAVSLCLAGWAWELAKEGYVRHDLHDLTFLGLATAALAIASTGIVRRPAAGPTGRPGTLRRRGRGLTRPGLLVASAQLGAVAVAAALACVANGGPPVSLVSPAESFRSLTRQVLDIASTKDWAGVQAAAKRQAVRTGDALPGRLLNALATHSFAVEPLEDSMSFAYPALRRWDPEPVLQAYSAYTTYLDHLDATFLASSRAPQVILYRPIATNGFDPAWEPPAATEALYCHYAEVTTADYWVLLRRVPDRCGRPVALGSVTAHFGERVSAPRPPAADEVVVARFSVVLPALSELENLAWKGPPVHIETWGYSAGSRPSTWRFVPATAGDDHVLDAPAALGWTAGYGPQQVGQFRFLGGGWSAGQGTVKVRFYAVPLRPEAK